MLAKIPGMLKLFKSLLLDYSISLLKVIHFPYDSPTLTNNPDLVLFAWAPEIAITCSLSGKGYKWKYLQTRRPTIVIISPRKNKGVKRVPLVKEKGRFGIIPIKIKIQ